LQARGLPWTEQSRLDVLTYWDKKKSGQEPVESLISALLAHIVLVGLSLACLQRTLTVLGEKKADTFKTLAVVLLLMCATTALSRITWYIEPSGYSVPITAMAILLVILTNMRVALVASLLTAGLMSVLYDYDWRLFVVSTAMCFAGAFSIAIVRKRGEMARATLKATLVGLVTVAAVTIATDSFAFPLLWQRLALVLVHGFLAYMLVPAVLSPLEKLFGITTDIQLLEYSDLNNEILGRLAIEVPATYAHSLMLGQLAEAAADAIGANGLKARVCAYYHDIGKMLRPEYFSENQTGVNIHDELTPRTSARAIASHITGGIELAREYHLPKPIIDGIAEHHGTMLISFFYQEALKQQKHGDVSEGDFRYPGPKPQSRETAILMICDAVESGVRSIKNPNEERVREFVDKIIQARSADRQFDECDITLKDLDRIGQIVTRRMLTSLHTRIAYPERETEKSDERPVPAIATAAGARDK
jgi:cyclic-di-AMP phosphodiesterase PgpH